MTSRPTAPCVGYLSTCAEIHCFLTGCDCHKVQPSVGARRGSRGWSCGMLPAAPRRHIREPAYSCSVNRNTAIDPAKDAANIDDKDRKDNDEKAKDEKDK